MSSWGGNEPCFSVCPFPSFLYSRRFRNDMSAVVIIMGLSDEKVPSPLVGEG